MTRIERLKAAIEGECEGLAITDGHARAILEYVDAAPAGWKMLPDTDFDQRSWPEDAAHENGFYSNVCCHCLRTFTGHKRRVVCKSCAAMAPTGEKPPTGKEKEQS
jgi:hypothetical protein